MNRLKQTNTPFAECINCWKFEIWTENLTDVTETFLYLLEEARRDPTLMGKMLKEPASIYESSDGRMGSCISHSIPEQAKPDRYLAGELDKDRFILIYNQSIPERDRRMHKIIGDLRSMGLYKKESAPYRRGCINPHEGVLGPWENWYDLDKDCAG